MTSELSVEVLNTADAVAQRAAWEIAAAAREAIEARGSFLFAVSGGHTPWLMLRALAAEEIPWTAMKVFQVDERVAPAGHADRNLTHLRESLLDHAPLSPEQIFAMPVEAEDLNRAAAEYARTLERECGSPAVLDLVHLGLGPDGHTASLVPGDPVLNTCSKDVALAGPYAGQTPHDADISGNKSCPAGSVGGDRRGKGANVASAASSRCRHSGGPCRRREVVCACRRRCDYGERKRSLKCV